MSSAEKLQAFHVLGGKNPARLRITGYIRLNRPFRVSLHNLDDFLFQFGTEHNASGKVVLSMFGVFGFRKPPGMCTV